MHDYIHMQLHSKLVSYYFQQIPITIKCASSVYPYINIKLEIKLVWQNEKLFINIFNIKVYCCTNPHITILLKIIHYKCVSCDLRHMAVNNTFSKYFLNKMQFMDIDLQISVYTFLIFYSVPGHAIKSVKLFYSIIRFQISKHLTKIDVLFTIVLNKLVKDNLILLSCRLAKLNPIKKRKATSTLSHDTNLPKSVSINLRIASINQR